ncbi:release factor glutamine methyltransferase [Jatrophihabitans sp. GAS493]|uniref:peptide chain release factor N(5)-glutamine methyltransferase n=1 Tax=Jatrophihabitans sp. GAS493 TaxID=1907575 RepID=UPI000BBF915A|nr:peptide chain release factor N(5)-glutamine methyltransferase [Jatrophihabitans sp. GAS493]SOD73040.1 release factor glutamine methyltransferase [Jatrophihabitans sp. GAS493]
MTLSSRERLQRAVGEAGRQLEAAGVASPRVDALALAAFVLGVPQLVVAVAPELDDSFEDRYRAVVERRARREPLQHIVGSAAFRYLSVQVRPGVFIPRPETELVAEAAINEALAVLATGRTPTLVDLCTGTGVIALALAQEVPAARVFAVDVSPDAVELASENAAALQLQVNVVTGDVADESLLPELSASVDVVVSNPPYVPPQDAPLPPEVEHHDPQLAVYGGGADGLRTPALVVTAAARLLRDGGLLVMEHDDSQGASARSLIEKTQCFSDVRTQVDLAGRDRFVLARRRAGSDR